MISIAWKTNNRNFVAYKNSKLAGMVSQNPNDPRVMDPRMWTCVIHTTDEGLIGLGVYKTALRARIALANALKRRWTYDTWQKFGRLYG